MLSCLVLMEKHSNAAQKNFKNIQIKIVLISTKELRKLLNSSDKFTNKFGKHLVLYSFNSKSFYIGKSETILVKQKHGQKSTSQNRNKITSCKQATTIIDKINYDGILLIDRNDIDSRLSLKEILHVNESNLNFNCINNFDVKALIF